MTGKSARRVALTSVFALTAGATIGITYIPAEPSEKANPAFTPAIQVATATPVAPIATKESEAQQGWTLAAALGPVKSAIQRVSTGNENAKPRWFEGGDKIKLMVYERLPDAELMKYGKNGFSEQNYQQRTEMSGEFVVSPEETLSIPMLGTFAVTGTTPQQLEATMATEYQHRMSRAGFVTIISVTRPDVLILGPVKTPGKVTFQPNMTVLHAIALAGGIKSGMGGDEPWQQMESIRERVNVTQARQDMAELYAQRAVLEAERDHISVQVPDALITLVGAIKAGGLIAAEQDRRRMIVQARQQQETGVEQQLEAVRQQIKSLQSTNMRMYDEAVALAEKRVAAYEGFARQGTVNNVQVAAAQKDLIDAKSRRDELNQRLTDARMNLGRLETDKALLVKSAGSDLSNMLQNVRQQISAQQEKSTASESILRAMGGGTINVAFAPDTGENTAAPHWTYKIVRSTANGPAEMPATDLTVLQPGDLVKVVIGNGTPASDVMPGLPQQGPLPTKAVPASAMVPPADRR